MDLAIKSIAFRNFRNYKTFDLTDLGPLTILVGPNAVGKTNVIEGIQLLTALTSFRHPTIHQIIHDHESYARLDIGVKGGARDLELSLNVEQGKKYYMLNGKSKHTTDLKGLVPSVTFTPDDLHLVKGSSSVKRDALDILGSQLSANHYVIKRDYEKVVRYKNRLLRDEASDDLIESINETLITCGAQLSWYRSALFEKMIPMIRSYYTEITGGHETMDACYIPSWEHHDPTQVVTYTYTRDEAREATTTALDDYRDEERARRRSLIGPHHDHVEFFIEGKNVALYGSQGQQRSIVLAFKLAEVSVIQNILHQKPILLLDDVMSELDVTRRDSLMSFIEGDIQTFITTTNLSYFNDDILARARVVNLPLGDDHPDTVPVGKERIA